MGKIKLEVVLNSDGNCANISEILNAIEQNWPNIKSSVLCELADIEPGTLNDWRKRGTARDKNAKLLVDTINSMPDDWDGEFFEVGDCLGSSFYR